MSTQKPARSWLQRMATFAGASCLGVGVAWFIQRAAELT